MKTQKFKILSLRMALLTILLSGLSMQNIYAFSETTKNGSSDISSDKVNIK